MERAVQGIEERKKQARRPQPGEQTGGALVDAEGNPIYGLGQDFPEEFQEEIEIAEAQLAAKQRSDEEQRQILAAAKAAEEQRKQQLRKAEQEAEAKARRIAKAEETAKRRDEELAQIREARLAQERSDLEQRAGGVLPEPAPEAPAPQVRKAKPLVKPPTQPTGEVVRQVKPPSPVRVETSADVELTPERYQQLFRENKDILETNLIVNQAVYKEEFADKFEEERLRLLKQYVDKLITDGKILEKDKQLVSDVVINSKVLTPAVRDKVLFSEQEVNRGATIYLDKNRDKDLFKRSDEFKQELNEQKTLLRDATATRRAQVATEGEALVEEAQGAGTEPQSAIRTNFTTYQSLLPEIQQLNQVGRPKAQRQDKIYIKNTSDKTLRGLEPGQETLITGYRKSK
jgi:hypothetical protein